MRSGMIALILLPLQPVVAGGWATSQARADDPTPRFLVTPARVLHDRELSIQLHGLKPGQRVTVRASQANYKSEVEFAADAKGNIDVGKTDPQLGKRVAPLQILWSMKRGPDAKVGGIEAGIDPIKVSLVALVDGMEIARGGFEMIYLSPDVERIPVKDGRLRGVFFRPKAKGKHPGVMTVGGSGGGVSETWAALLAAHGYAVLTLAYFNYDDLPAALENIPLEYFDEGLTWLEKQDGVVAGRLAVIGGSRGGELALLLGTRFPNVTAVVAYVPSHLVIPSPPPKMTSAWTHQDKPVPFFEPKVNPAELLKVFQDNPGNTTPAWRLWLSDKEAAKKAAIPAEKINGPVLLISGKDDRMWPSAEMAEEVARRLREHKHPYTVRHLSYDDAGHMIGVPNQPTGDAQRLHPMTKQSLALGGTSPGNAFAAWDSWAQLLKFLGETFNEK